MRRSFSNCLYLHIWHQLTLCFIRLCFFSVLKRQFINRTKVKSLNKSRNSITSNEHELSFQNSWFFHVITTIFRLFFLLLLLSVQVLVPLPMMFVGCEEVIPSCSLKMHAFHYHLLSFGVCYTCFPVLAARFTVRAHTIALLKRMRSFAFFHHWIVSHCVIRKKTKHRQV